jgi:hypothetical protein
VSRRPGSLEQRFDAGHLGDAGGVVGHRAERVLGHDDAGGGERADAGDEPHDATIRSWRGPGVPTPADREAGHRVGR